MEKQGNASDGQAKVQSATNNDAFVYVLQLLLPKNNNLLSSLYVMATGGVKCTNTQNARNKYITL